MNTIRLTAGDARNLFCGLSGLILMRDNGLGTNGIRIDAFIDDQFVVTDYANFDQVPLPRHIRFEHQQAYVVNSPCLPEVIEANELSLDRPTNGDTFLWDLSGIKKISCGQLLLIDPGQFPRAIVASDIEVAQSEEARQEGDPDLSNRRIELMEPNLWPHIKFLVLIGGLPLANVMGLELLIDGSHLHDWADRPGIIAEWKKCPKKIRTAMDNAISCYESIHAAKAALKTATPSTAGMIVEVDLV